MIILSSLFVHVLYVLKRDVVRSDNCPSASASFSKDTINAEAT